MSFIIYRQLDQMDCGPTCLRMIAKHYGRNFNLRTLSKLCEFSKEGISLLGLSDGAEKIGFRSLGAKINIEGLTQAELPAILHWRQNHFVVLIKIEKNKYHIADPSTGLVILKRTEFRNNW